MREWASNCVVALGTGPSAWRIMARASSSGCPADTRCPRPPMAQASGMPSSCEAITGRPQAWASKTTEGKASVAICGWTRQSSAWWRERGSGCWPMSRARSSRPRWRISSRRSESIVPDPARRNRALGRRRITSWAALRNMRWPLPTGRSNPPTTPKTNSLAARLSLLRATEEKEESWGWNRWVSIPVWITWIFAGSIRQEGRWCRSGTGEAGSSWPCKRT